MTKYVSLYEDYTNVGQKGLPKLHTWSDIRDSINNKESFMIIDFKDQDSLDQCVQSEIHQDDYSEQTYNTKNVDRELISMPSVFVFCKDPDCTDRAKSLLKRFKIKRLIIGIQGEKYPKAIIAGDTVEFSSDIMTGISPDDMEMDDYYKNGSTYYKFIN